MSCTHDPRELAGQPIGMYHCPDCGEMIVAGMEHTPRMPPLLLDWLRDPIANEAPYNAQQLRDLAHDEIVRLQTERLELQIERDKLLDRIGVLERRIEAKEILSSSPTRTSREQSSEISAEAHSND